MQISSRAGGEECRSRVGGEWFCVNDSHCIFGGSSLYNGSTGRGVCVCVGGGGTYVLKGYPLPSSPVKWKH